MEEVLKNVTQIFDQFKQEEVGNRLSQFAILSLRTIVLDEIKKLGAKQNVSDIREPPDKG